MMRSSWLFALLKVWGALHVLPITALLLKESRAQAAGQEIPETKSG